MKGKPVMAKDFPMLNLLIKSKILFSRGIMPSLISREDRALTDRQRCVYLYHPDDSVYVHADTLRAMLILPGTGSSGLTTGQGL